MPSQYEMAYAELISDIMLNGEDRPTRNHPTRAVFGRMLTVNELTYGEFPILQGRKMYPAGVFGELAAFLKGPKTVKDLEIDANVLEQLGYAKKKGMGDVLEEILNEVYAENVRNNRDELINLAKSKAGEYLEFYKD